jgi:hypothetical protein
MKSKTVVTFVGLLALRLVFGCALCLGLATEKAYAACQYVDRQHMLQLPTDLRR